MGSGAKIAAARAVSSSLRAGGDPFCCASMDVPGGGGAAAQQLASCSGATLDAAAWVLLDHTTCGMGFSVETGFSDGVVFTRSFKNNACWW